MTKFPSCNGERSWWLLSNDKCLQSATARTLWKKGESSAPSVFHAFLCAICERALNLYVCRGGALWLAYHRTQTQSATQWECLLNPSTDIDSYYSYDTRTRQKCFIRTGYSFQPSIRLNSNIHSYELSSIHLDLVCTHTRGSDQCLSTIDPQSPVNFTSVTILYHVQWDSFTFCLQPRWSMEQLKVRYVIFRKRIRKLSRGQEPKWTCSQSAARFFFSPCVRV